MGTLSFFILVAVFAYFLYRVKVKGEARDVKRSATAPSRTAPPAVDSRPVVEETISVVLRRQVPVRFDESPRSWLGGLPMMPGHVQWPTAKTTDHADRGPTPLHFVAQVACADLPRELWGGLGPRTGWLLLFLKGEDWDVMENPEALQVIHISELGPERQPPPGIFPVHDEIYTGPDYGFVRNQAEVPTVWRRWPVDLVTVPKRPGTGDRGVSITPEGFASILYENAAVAERDGRIVTPDGSPFSWRGALYVVDSIARVLSSGRLPELREKDRDKVSSAAWLEQTTAAITDGIAKDNEALKMWDVREFDADDAKALAQRDRAKKTLSEKIANLNASLEFLQQGDPWPRLNDSLEAFREWRSAQKARVTQLRERILSHDLDTPLPAEDWEALRAELDRERFTYWVLGYRDLGQAVPTRTETSLLTFAAKGLEASKVQIAADYYAASAAKRSMVPPAMIETLEPHWRRLYDNLPHRMGGIHDGIQSDQRVGPATEVLLFQIVTDDAMHWIWGDAGAYYVFIATDRLAKNDFSQLQSFFENH